MRGPWQEPGAFIVDGMQLELPGRHENPLDINLPVRFSVQGANEYCLDYLRRSPKICRRLTFHLDECNFTVTTSIVDEILFARTSTLRVGPHDRASHTPMRRSNNEKQSAMGRASTQHAAARWWRGMGQQIVERTTDSLPLVQFICDCTPDASFRFQFSQFPCAQHMLVS